MPTDVTCKMLAGVKFVPKFGLTLEPDWKFIGHAVKLTDFESDVYAQVDAKGDIYIGLRWEERIDNVNNAYYPNDNYMESWRTQKRLRNLYRICNHFHMWQWPRFDVEAAVVRVP